jgi:hypothetical protein
MAFLPTPNGIKTVTQFHHGDNYWQNHLWFFAESVDTETLQALADLVQNAMYTNLHTVMSLNVYGDWTRAFDMTQQNGPYRQNTGDAWYSTEEIVLADLALALCVTHRTDKRGRAYRGRSYFSGWGLSQLGGNILSGTCGEAVLAVFEDIDDAVGALNCMRCVHTTQVNGVPLTVGDLTAVTLTEIRSLVTTSQRRRVRRI